MSPVFIALFTLFASGFRTHTALQAEIAALRHQIAVLQLSAPRRLRLKQSDRFLWIVWSWVWPQWRRWLRILKPDTVVRWHRRAFARYWTWKSRRRPGRPTVVLANSDLIDKLRVAVPPSIPWRASFVGSLGRCFRFLSQPCDASARDPSLSAINSAFCSAPSSDPS